MLKEHFTIYEEPTAEEYIWISVKKNPGIEVYIMFEIFYTYEVFTNFLGCFET